MINILSIQSHVSYGHAGNSSAVFPLQRMGCNVWPVYTVLFSNHTGHGSWRGPIIQPETVLDIVTGIEERGVLKDCSAVLSGYMGAAQIGEAILESVAKVRAANPDTLYCCDPVIGDTDRGIFVKEGIPEFFSTNVVHHADILTPNHFELELLTGMKVTDLTSALEAARHLMASMKKNGPGIVLVTSLIRDDAEDDTIEMLAVSPEQGWLVNTPRLSFPTPINGSGDATAATFLARYLQTKNLKTSLEHTAGSLYALFENTKQAGGRELQLIASQDAFVEPPRSFVASSVSH